jgi:hypothetical protein
MVDDSLSSFTPFNTSILTAERTKPKSKKLSVYNVVQNGRNK